MAAELNIERRRLHGYEYSPAEQAEKDLALAQMKLLNPHVSAVMREWVYDYVTKEVGNEEMSRRIASGYYDKKPSSRVVPSHLTTQAPCE